MPQQLDLERLRAAAGLPTQSASAPPPAAGGLDLGRLRAAAGVDVSTPEPPADDPSLIKRAADRVIPLGLRVGGAVVGGVLGSALGPAGTIGGGAAGSALGETLAEGYEVLRGRREELNPTQIAVQGALGAVPVVGRAGSIGRTVLSRTGQGAVLSGASDVGTKLAEGETPTFGSVATSAGLGAALGGPLGALEARATARAAAARAGAADVSPSAVVENVPTAVETPVAPAPRVENEGQGLLPLDEPNRRLLPHERRTESQIERIALVEGNPIPDAKRIEKAKIAAKESVKTLPEETQAGVLRVLEENNGFQAQRRDVQPVARTRALAEYIQVDRRRALPKGTALNAEQLTAYSNAAATLERTIDDLATKVKSGNASPWEVAALEKARREHVVLVASWRGSAAEAGRSLNILKHVDQVLRSHDENGVKAIEAALKHPKIKENINKFAEEWAGLGGDPIKQMEYIRSNMESKAWDKVSTLFYSGILSGVRTHIRNVLGNTANNAFTLASKVPTALYDAAQAARTGREREVFLHELKPQLVGTWVGIRQGIDDFLFTMKHGFGRTSLDTFDVPRVELGGGGKNPFNWTGRLLEAEDQFFRTVAYHQELAARSYAAARKEAMKKGLRGAQMDEAIRTRMAEWTIDPPAELREAAATAAKRTVFKEDPGTVVANIQRFKGDHPWLNFVVPFVRTPAAIIRQAIEATPATQLTAQSREALARGGRDAAEVVGRAVAGTAALTSLGMLALQGKISGPGPASPNERAALYEHGWRPNSVLIGDTWVDYTQIQPLAQALFAVTAAADLYKQGQSPDPVLVLAHSMGAILDQSFLSGVSDLINAVSDADRYAQSYKEKLAASIVPFGGLARNLAQTVDPVVRDPKTAGEAIQAIIPGLSQNVAPKITRFGDDVRRPGTVMERGLSPVIRSEQTKDPILVELNRLGITNIAPPTKRLREAFGLPAMDLTTEEQRSIGTSMKSALERLFASNQYKQLQPDMQRGVVDRVLSEARSSAIAQIRSGRVSAQKK